jgi:hypothetical protein
MGAENRASPRYALEAEIEVSAASGLARGRTDNLSRGGFAAVVDRAIERGSTVRVKIALVFAEDSFSEPLELTARIVWDTQLGSDRHQIGASFISLTAAEKEYLEMFLRYLEEGAESDEDDDDDDQPEDDDPFAS